MQPATYTLETLCVRRVSPDGVISTVAGNGIAAFSGDGGPATSASLNQPHGLAVDNAGSLYIAEFAGHRIRKVPRGGIITTVAGNGIQGFSGMAGRPSAPLWAAHALFPWMSPGTSMSATHTTIGSAR